MGTVSLWGLSTFCPTFYVTLTNVPPIRHRSCKVIWRKNPPFPILPRLPTRTHYLTESPFAQVIDVPNTKRSSTTYKPLSRVEQSFFSSSTRLPVMVVRRRFGSNRRNFTSTNHVVVNTLLPLPRCTYQPIYTNTCILT